MIPKIIHYCWFGKPELPQEVKRCMASWEKYCPDYKIKLWNESNFPIHDFPFAEQAYEQKRYAFVADVARIYALENEGGVYMDTDMELIKPIDELLAFEGFAGFEDDTYVAVGIIGSQKNGLVINKLLEKYAQISDFNERQTIPKVISEVLSESGFEMNGKHQTKFFFELFPTEYFYPKSYHTGLTNITVNTFGIHHYDASWVSDKASMINNQKKMRIKLLFAQLKDELPNKNDFLTIMKNHLNLRNKDLIIYALKSLKTNLIRKK